METTFYKHDSYLTIRRKFTGAWTNLRLELHSQSEQFWKEGDDEFDDDTRFFPSHIADEPLFTLTSETTKATARRLFSDYFGNQGLNGNYIEAFVYGNFAGEVAYTSENATLGECNNPFILQLNRFPYGEFKQKFAEHWTNLSIEIYQSEMQNGELSTDAAELPEDFEMKNFTRINRLVINEFYECDGVRYSVEKRANESALYDELYLSSFENSLKNSGIAVRIKNERLGIYWSQNLKQAKLQDFQNAMNECGS
jgi:hypothetical protein